MWVTVTDYRIGMKKHDAYKSMKVRDSGEGKGMGLRGAGQGAVRRK
jgi:hypothetical protein